MESPSSLVQDFVPFRFDADSVLLERIQKAAIEKLQTLFPDKGIVAYDLLTLGIGTDSLYSDTGLDIYELGLAEGDVPAIRNQRDACVITLRV
ncbi:MAG: hypothetical protein KBS75_00020 [Bacteroidales bacterium]|nr:hypothetical protein [Candidatus Equimonas faecalis]